MFSVYQFILYSWSCKSCTVLFVIEWSVDVWVDRACLSLSKEQWNNFCIFIQLFFSFLLKPKFAAFIIITHLKPKRKRLLLLFFLFRKRHKLECRSFIVRKMEGGGGARYNPRTVEEVFRDFKGRRAGILRALTTGLFLLFSFFLKFSFFLLWVLTFPSRPSCCCLIFLLNNCSLVL